MLVTFIIMCAGMLSSCGGDTYRQADGAAWGTTYHITYRADRDLSDSIVAEMQRVNMSLSAFEPASDRKSVV